ncbi:DUF6442 family protein [uncultured Dysosmobacter sp.]|uniref:DUF6442 family protein n=1 Tax=uncultured Dysosmobacter sp. TaxID=2591384 RepID=UPI00261EFE13|nr:DUF6442 family protein [uncultured Dysosmobacter sp.]
MNKEEILEKSRQENRNRDEMERAVYIEGESFSVLFVFLLGLVLIHWKRLHGLPTADVFSMFWISCVANRLYRLTKRRSISDVITLLISLAFLVWNLVQFFTQG